MSRFQRVPTSAFPFRRASPCQGKVIRQMPCRHHAVNHVVESTIASDDDQGLAPSLIELFRCPFNRILAVRETKLIHHSLFLHVGTHLLPAFQSFSRVAITYNAPCVWVSKIFFRTPHQIDNWSSTLIKFLFIGLSLRMASAKGT